jgi:hypothetical protein
MHHLVLDIEVQFAAQEAAKVLVDEIVEGVARGVALQMPFEARIAWRLAVQVNMRFPKFGNPRGESGISNR